MPYPPQGSGRGLTTLPPHTHDASEIVSGVLSLDRIPVIPHSKLDVENTPAHGQALTYNSTTNRLRWETIAGGGAGLRTIVNNDDEVSTTATTNTTFATIRFNKLTDDKTLIIVFSGRVSASGITGTITIQIDGTTVDTFTITSTTETVVVRTIDISAIPTGLRTLTILWRTSSGTLFNRYFEVLVRQ